VAFIKNSVDTSLPSTASLARSVINTIHPRAKRQAIRNEKLKLFLQGLDFAGVEHLRIEDLKLEPTQRYIHHIMSYDGIKIIVTMVPGLAQLFHSVKATQHDNTYKRHKGEFHEWEVTIWNNRLNMSKSLPPPFIALIKII